MHFKPLFKLALKPLLFALMASLTGLVVHAGSCNVTTPGAATCAIPAGVTSVTVVATGGGGGGGSGIGSDGGSGAIVTATLSGVGGTTLSLYVGGGGGGNASGGGGGGGSTNVNAGTPTQVIAGGGGGGGSGNGKNGGGGNGGGGGGNGGGVGGIGVGGYGDGGGGGIGGGAFGLGTGGGAGNGNGNGIGGNGTKIKGGGGGGGGYGGGGGGWGGTVAGTGSGGGGGGSTGGVVTLASNGGAAGSNGGNGGNGSIVITWADEPIPTVIPPTSKVDPGITTTVTPKDLSSGQGPALVVCLTDALTPVFAPAAVAYLGQSADGSARYSIASSPAQVLSFYPLSATTATGSGITLSGNNVLTVATRCGTFTTEPALFNRSEFGALVASMGLTAAINDQGVITIQSGSTIYVARPDYLVTNGTPGAPSLTQGADGLYRFTDSAGNVQVLRPAFLMPDVLRTALGASLGSQFVSFVVQTDGTGLLTTSVNGANQSAVLTPALTLGTVPAEHWVDSVWGSGSTWTYQVFTFGHATQGYAAKPWLLSKQ